MCIAIVCFLDCDVINFEINLIFLIKPFLCMIKKLRQRFKHLENEKRWKKEVKQKGWKQTKSIFHNFKGLSVAKYLLDLTVRL